MVWVLVKLILPVAKQKSYLQDALDGTVFPCSGSLQTQELIRCCVQDSLHKEQVYTTFNYL